MPRSHHLDATPHWNGAAGGHSPSQATTPRQPGDCAYCLLQTRLQMLSTSKRKACECQRRVLPRLWEWESKDKSATGKNQGPEGNTGDGRVRKDRGGTHVWPTCAPSGHIPSGCSFPSFFAHVNSFSASFPAAIV